MDINGILCIKNWEERFEDSNTVKIDKLSWVKQSNRLDDGTYMRIMSHKNKGDLFIIYTGIIALASRPTKTNRGMLVDSNGVPLSIEDIAFILRYDIETTSMCIKTLLDPKFDFIFVQPFGSDPTKKEDICAQSESTRIKSESVRIETESTRIESESHPNQLVLNSAFKREEKREEENITPPTPSRGRVSEDFLKNSFKTFFEVYPKKADARAAYLAFTKNVDPEADMQDLMRATKNYSDSVAEKETRFIKLAVNFLSDRQWLGWVDSEPIRTKADLQKQAEQAKIAAVEEKKISAQRFSDFHNSIMAIEKFFDGLEHDDYPDYKECTPHKLSELRNEEKQSALSFCAARYEKIIGSFFKSRSETPARCEKTLLELWNNFFMRIPDSECKRAVA